MGLTDPKDIRMIWGSHIPVLKALRAVLPAATWIECGSGQYSTRILAGAPMLTTIEHDPSWAKRVQEDHKPSPTHAWIVHPLPIQNWTSEAEAGDAKLNDARAFYRSLAVNGEILFMDTFRACRVMAIESLGDKADMIVLHDTELQSWGYYGLPRILPMRDRIGYSFRPAFQRAESIVPWTDIWSRQPIDLEAFNAVAGPAAVALWGSPVELKEWTPLDAA